MILRIERQKGDGGDKFRVDELTKDGWELIGIRATEERARALVALVQEEAIP